MRIFSLFLLQLIAVMLIFGTPVKSGPAQFIKHSVKEVLGVKYFAEDATPETSAETPAPNQEKQDGSSGSQPAQGTENSQPANQNITNSAGSQPEAPPQKNESSSPQTTSGAPDGATQTTGVQPQDKLQESSGQKAPKNSGESSGAEFSSEAKTSASEPFSPQDNKPLPAEEMSITDQEVSSTTGENNSAIPSSQNQPAENKSESSVTSEAEKSLTIVNESVSKNPAALPLEEIDKDSLAKAEQEDKKIEDEQDAGKKAELLLASAKNNIVDLNKTIPTDSFATTSFLAQRVTDKINKLGENLDKIEPSKQEETRRQARIFCQQANLSLSSQQLIVPEELEQDLEIARASCLSMQ